MLSLKELVRIVRDEVENKIRKDERPYGFYYILLDGKMYPQNDYDEEVAKGTRSSNDIYALVDVWHPSDFDDFLFHIDYLAGSSAEDIVRAYLRKLGFAITNVAPPTPNLKYYIDAGIKRGKDRKPEYLVVNIYDIDALAESFRIPQIAEQKLGNKPREITSDDAFNIHRIVAWEQPLLAGHAYRDAYDILYGYYVDHKKKYNDEARKLALVYLQLFPLPYRVCYEWKAGIFVEIDCLKIERLRFSS